ncbi:MAG TPA: hypothetical protein VF898_00635 [Chloroflexota bacterium]
MERPVIQRDMTAAAADAPLQVYVARMCFLLNRAIRDEFMSAIRAEHVHDNNPLPLPAKCQ